VLMHSLSFFHPYAESETRARWWQAVAGRVLRAVHDHPARRAAQRTPSAPAAQRTPQRNVPRACCLMLRCGERHHAWFREEMSRSATVDGYR